MTGNIFLPVQNLRRTTINHFGICWILFFKHSDIEAWPEIDPSTGVINAALVFKDNTNFFTAQFLEKDRFFSEAQRDAPAGPYVETTVNGILGGNSLVHITSITAMLGGKFGVLIKERNGEQRLIGNQDAGAKFIWDYTSGSDNQSRKRNCKWVFESPFPAPIYQGGAIIIDDQIIPVGGAPAGTTETIGLDLVIPGFEVGPGAPMINGDLSFSHANLLNKKVMVFADGIKIPQSDAPILGRRTITKVINQNTISFNGGVAAPEFIEIFIHP